MKKKIKAKIVSKQNLFSLQVNAIKTMKFNFAIIAVST